MADPGLDGYPGLKVVSNGRDGYLENYLVADGTKIVEYDEETMHKVSNCIYFNTDSEFAAAWHL